MSHDLRAPLSVAQGKLELAFGDGDFKDHFQDVVPFWTIQYR